MNTPSPWARDHALRLDSVDDVIAVMGSGVRRCIFTPEDIAPEFFDLKTRLAGNIFQKLMNYRCEIGIVVPPDHGYGDRFTELAREHARHPVIRMFESEAAAIHWSREASP